MHAPQLDTPETIRSLPERHEPYWNILEYCRHLGLEKRSGRPAYWIARVRKSDGGYKQKRLARARAGEFEGIAYAAALKLARRWFAEPGTASVASVSYPVGTAQHLDYCRNEAQFTVGNALFDYVEWKRIAATPKTFETLLALINFHIVPRLGDVPLEELTGSLLTGFCREILETPPKRGNQRLGCRVEISSLTPDALRRRKGTLNTLLGILRTATRMAWENGNTESERAWRCIRRVPNLEVPRQIFLTRDQCRRLIQACRPDLANLVRAALYSGCRVSELADLRAGDIGRDIFGIYVASPKGGRPRHIYLPEEGMRFFLSMCAGKAEQDHVFRTRSGQLWRGRHKHLFKDAVRSANLPAAFVFHGLRHTYASQLVQAGAPLAMVARQLGHTNTDTVSRTYGHLSCESIERELAMRFASLEQQTSEHDAQMHRLRTSLQNPRDHELQSSWPRSNFGSCGEEVVRLVRNR